jgi:hypothetical protein
MAHLHCPYCDFFFELNGKHFGGGLPPTGGDYEWSESDTERKCPSCEKKIKLRLRADTETGVILKVCGSPKLLNEGITWYAVGTVNEDFWDKGFFSVAIYFLYQNFEEAQQKARHPYQLLKVTKDGYFLYENGNFATTPLPELDYKVADMYYGGY